ncbi:prolyl oligopeptidase family serine peptidase [Sphingomicrobium nitratireducens]|uniref:prolyl oligopeptidase family serine peptidase n=1 Tax=Sphingomicrobium nitratireducens TaxID=2964666 RepID=UPI00223FA603|nr:prolyl oligopeptidase family serine peptidase [Sphingomicrobium nitratireducens]
MRLALMTSLAALSLTACAAQPAELSEAPPPPEPVLVVPSDTKTVEGADPYLWLEDIEGAEALAAVEEWNAATEDALADMPGVQERAARALALLNSPDRIVTPDVIGDKVLNHWTDEKNKRGLWRIADLDDYVAGSPEWKTLIDVDALGAAEGESWVWHGADCMAPDYKRCIIALSPGGTDADVRREFDMETGQFVEGGFALPLGKTEVSWVDEDTLLVSMDEGGDTLTESGYPRISKLWTRGTPWSEAVTVMEVPREEMWLFPSALVDGDTRWNLLQSGPDFFNQYRYVLVDGKAVKLPIPISAEVQTVLDGQLVATLFEPMGNFAKGDLVSWDMAAMARGQSPAPTLVFRPSASQAVDGIRTTDNRLWISVLDDVSGRLLFVAHGEEGWTQPGMIALPDNSTLTLVGDAGSRDMVFLTVDTMLDPTALYAVGTDGMARKIQQLPTQFDASGMKVAQHFATSKDGTKVPYFLVTRGDVTEATGTLIHAYGGFRAPQLPGYLVSQPYRSGPLGLFWVESGGAYVLANIRGGGEYGPRWHQDALRDKRQNSFDDLAAVAEDLIARGIAREDGIAISGRSNGGVLTGAAITQRPDLYDAAIIGSPLFDMQRYHKLLAGASWVGEYGNPDNPDDWAFMKLYSPYQNIKPGVDYPATFWYLSTKDDRVHPGHARKGAAKLAAYGNTVYYRENTEGGHSVGSDNEADALRAAMEWGFLMKEIGTTR